MPFDPDDAKMMLALAAALEKPILPPPLPSPPAPVGWELLFTSPVLGAFDNRWQLWGDRGRNRYAVIIRGTVATVRSFLGDFMAVLIPASTSLPTIHGNLPVRLADDPEAAVHLGFALGMATVMFDGRNGILAKVPEFAPPGAEVRIVGHSQGAAIATLCRSFLHYSDILAGRGYSYPTYLFAQPKPGNGAYARDFERITGRPESAFSIINSLDWVPHVPLTMEALERLKLPNPLSLLFRDSVFRRFVGSLVTISKTWHQLPWVGSHSPLKRLEFAVLPRSVLSRITPPPILLPRILGTRGFENCGVLIRLAGLPGGSNPDNPQDYFWHHHAEMYYQLLCREYPSASAASTFLLRKSA